MPYSARKPFSQLVESIVAMFKAPVRYIKQSNVIESQFEKPYLDREYNRMHMKPPHTTWPRWNLRGGIADPSDDCHVCSIYLDAVTFMDCEKYPVEVHAAAFCSKYFGGYWPEGYPDVFMVAEVTEGKQVKQEIGQWSYLGPSLAIWLDPTIKTHHILVRQWDDYGNSCWISRDVQCRCNCLTAETFAVDEGSTPNTIPLAGSADVYVTGGCYPYSWSVSGTGYSVAAEETDAPVNTISVVGGT